MKDLLKNIYNLLPFKKEIFSVLKIFWKPGESVYRHLHFKGVFKVKVDDKSSFKINHYGFLVENEIFWAGLLGNWEKESLSIWIRLCRQADVIFDLGANTGVYSLIAKSINPDSKVYAFEPVARVFSKLKENISLNNYDITAIEKAVSNADGTAVIHDTVSEHTYSVTVNAKREPGDQRVIETKIPIVTLNTFIRQNNIGKIDLMKIDVETHEPEVLEGFSDFFFKFRPTVLIEILTPEVGARINDIMKGSGYLYFYLDEQGGARLVNEITISEYYNYLLCPPEAAKKIGLL
jgi:FkbM family methyltransferase